MCGIIGSVGSKTDESYRLQFQQALAYLRSRGPDARGLHFADNMALGHHRLSILDVDARSNQPFVSSCGRWVIAFNGEIYNHRQLRAELTAQGSQFRTQSDTEVILNGFIAQGESFLPRMIGDWAFAIWDKIEQTIWLCRDRLGVKPFYIFQDHQQVVFSSEIKPILHLQPQIGIERHLLTALQYRYQPDWQTPFRGVVHARPGHLYKITCPTDGRPQIDKKIYWQIQPTERSRFSDQQAIEKFRELFEDSIKLQVGGDASLGVFLSGGLDSSSMASVAKKLTVDLQAFSIHMGEGQDETQQSRQWSQQLGIPLHICQIANSQLGDYSTALYHTEEPILDSILLATQNLAAFASQKVKVVLSGEGADEILGGYVHHRSLAMEYRFSEIFGKQLTAMLFNLVQHSPLCLLERLFPYNARLGQSGLRRLRHHLQSFPNRAASYASVVRLFDQNMLQEIVVGSCIDQVDWNQIFAPYQAQSTLQAVTQVDSVLWNCKYTLQRLDKLTMAHGLEARVPFLDHRLVEFVLALPDKQRLRYGQEKWILRQTAQSSGWLPKSIAQRKKRAFYLPVEKVYGEKFRQFATEILLDDRTYRRNFFNKPAIEKWLRNPFEEILAVKQITALTMLEIWFRLFEDGDWKNKLIVNEP